MRTSSRATVFYLALYGLAAAAPARGGAPKAATPEEVRKALAEATAAVEAIEREQAAPAEPNPVALLRRVDEEQKAALLLALAKARSAVGDPAAADAWARAADAAAEVPAPADRCDALIGLAEAQAGAGLKADALAAARQAAQSARGIRPDGMRLPFGMPDQPGPELVRAKALARVSGVQARAGDPDAARETARRAAEAAAAIKDPSQRVEFLIEAAKAAPDADAAAAWDAAAAFAKGLGDPYDRGRGVEAVLRARCRKDGVAAAAGAAERLDGDLRAFAVWVLADHLAASEANPDRRDTGRVGELARGSTFDLPSKKSKAYARLAEAQARARDAEGAEASLATLDADTPIRRGAFIVARVKLLTNLADAELKAGEKARARDALGIVLELIAPFEADWEKAFPLDRIAKGLAEAGDLSAALELAARVPGPAERVRALTGVARSQAEAGDRAAAAKTISLASEAESKVPAEALWLAEGDDRFATGPKYQSRRLIAVARAAAGDAAAAAEAVHAMRNEPGMPARFEAITAASEVAEAQAKAGDYAGALATAGPAGFDPYLDAQRNELIQKIARGQAAAGDAPGVVAWVTKLDTAKAKAAALLGMALGIPEKRPDPTRAD